MYSKNSKYFEGHVLYCTVLYRFCHFWHTSFWPTSTAPITTPQWQDWCPPPNHYNPNIIWSCHWGFPSVWLNLTLSLLHHTTQRPLSPEAAVTRAAWGGWKPGHISAFPVCACETTAIGRRQPNRIQTDGFFFSEPVRKRFVASSSDA